MNIEGFYLMEDHAKPLDDEEDTEAGGGGSVSEAAPKGVAAAQHGAALPLEQREVTAILVRTITPLVTPGLRNVINEGRDAQAVLPVLEIYGCSKRCAPSSRRCCWLYGPDLRGVRHQHSGEHLQFDERSASRNRRHVRLGCQSYDGYGDHFVGVYSAVAWGVEPGTALRPYIQLARRTAIEAQRA